MGNVTYDWSPVFGAVQGIAQQLIQQKQYQDLLKTLGTGMPGGGSPFGGPSSAPPSPMARTEDDNGMPLPGRPAPIMQAQGGAPQPSPMGGAAFNMEMFRKLPPQIGIPLLMQTMQAQMGGRGGGIKDVDPTHDIIDSAGNLIRQGRAKEGDKQAVPLTADEVAQLGLPKGTVAQRMPNGQIGVISSPKEPKEATQTVSQQNAAALGLVPGTKEYNDYIRADTLPQANGDGDANKPPSGYRWGKGGALEFIPGGPADPAVAGRGTGRPTEDQAKNSQLYNRAKEQLPIVLENFDSLGSVQSVIADSIPGIGNYLGGERYQRADGALKDIAASYLYSVSGATATPSEIAGTVERVRPKATDSAATKADKKKRIQDMVESIAQRAGPGLNAPSAQPSPQATGLPQGWSVKVK